MPNSKTIVSPDSKRRVLLPKNVELADCYEVEVRPNQEIVFRPRMIVDPREVISSKTLQSIDRAMTHLNHGKVGEVIDLSYFSSDEAVEKNEKKQASAKKLKAKK